jgi:hypothetical protein
MFELTLDVQMARELVDVAAWYNMTPSDYARHVLQRALDEVADNINPQLDCWAGRHGESS